MATISKDLREILKAQGAIKNFKGLEYFFNYNKEFDGTIIEIFPKDRKEYITIEKNNISNTIETKDDTIIDNYFNTISEEFKGIKGTTKDSFTYKILASKIYYTFSPFGFPIETIILF